MQLLVLGISIWVDRKSSGSKGELSSEIITLLLPTLLYQKEPRLIESSRENAKQGDERAVDKEKC